MIGGHLLHGGDYNPEQWIEYPEILEEDLKLMNKANVNCVTLGVFSWAELEPKEDVYTFEWLEEIIDKLREEEDTGSFGDSVGRNAALAYTKVSRDASGAGGRYGKPAGEAP